MKTSPLWKERLASVAVLLCRIQISALYFHAAIGKLAVEEWRNGTAVWYWFLDPMIGAPRWADYAIASVLRSALVVAGVTWGTIALEMVLAMAIFMQPRHRRSLFLVAVCFHAGIVLIHGLVSFSLAMTAGLVLLLRFPNSLPTMRVASANLQLDAERCASGPVSGIAPTAKGVV